MSAADVRMTITLDVARAVLWHYGDTNLGVQPGSLRQALMVAIARADLANTELLRAGFPELVYAVQAVRDKPWGLDWLRGIVKADLDHADRGLDMAVL